MKGSQMANKGRNSDSQTGDDNAEPKRPSCFVIMPIADHPDYPSGHFSEVYKYLIRPAVEAAGYECERADDTSSAHLIHADIIGRIYRAELCICDLSSRNPNVLFELGFRQAFDKPVVLMKDDSSAKIFDVDPFRTIFYDRTMRPQTLEKDRSALAKAVEETMSKHGTDGEFTSLIRFLKLEAAVLAKSEISAEDARLALLTQKVDALTGLVERQILRSTPTPYRSDRINVSAQLPDENIRTRRQWLEAKMAAASNTASSDFAVGDRTLRKTGGTIFEVGDDGTSYRKIAYAELADLAGTFSDSRDQLAFKNWLARET